MNSIDPGKRVRIGACGDLVVGPFAGRLGRVSHPVPGHSADGGSSPVWVVAVARSHMERRLLKANPHGNHYENASSWVPVPASLLEIVSDDEGGAVAEVEAPGKRPRYEDDAAAGKAATEGVPAALGAAGQLQRTSDAVAADAQQRLAAVSVGGLPSVRLYPPRAEQT